MNCLRVAASRAIASAAVVRPAAASAAALSVRNHSTFDTSDYQSPFASAGKKDTTRIPDFSKYKGGNAGGNKLFGYFMVGTMGVLSAAGAKVTIQGELDEKEERKKERKKIRILEGATRTFAMEGE